MSETAILERNQSSIQRSRHHALGFLLTLSSIKVLDQIDWKNEYDAVLSRLKYPIHVVNFFLDRARVGDANIQFICGVLYELGLDIPQSHVRAFQYFKLAANQGLAKAQYELASYYLRITKKQEALKYMLLAADQSYLPALLILAYRYDKGMDIKENPEKAIEYYKKAFKICENHPCYVEHQLFIKKKLLICQKALTQRQAILKRNAYCLQARRHYAMLDHEIFYENSSLLNTSQYEQDRHLDTLKSIFEQSKQNAVHVLFPHMSYEETILIRDAMLENPKMVIITTKQNGYSLQEAFYRLGYNPDYLKRCSLDHYSFSNFYGFLFVGTSTHHEPEKLKNKVYWKVFRDI